MATFERMFLKAVAVSALSGAGGRVAGDFFFNQYEKAHPGLNEIVLNDLNFLHPGNDEAAAIAYLISLAGVLGLLGLVVLAPFMLGRRH